MLYSFQLNLFFLQVGICVDIHQSVAVASKQFLVELSRHNYVTPTSYLELLGTFGKLIQLKKTEVSTQRNRTKTGLDKVQTVRCVVMSQPLYPVHGIILMQISGNNRLA